MLSLTVILNEQIDVLPEPSIAVKVFVVFATIKVPEGDPDVCEIIGYVLFHEIITKPLPGFTPALLVWLVPALNDPPPPPTP